tara:strand:+ start:205 stop:675 length:471 start_codon:yes stop_codon:yes gene_type:complete
MYFFNIVLSYFAEPNFIEYDEWFDFNLEKTKYNDQHKKIKTISKMHDFFYEQSNYKIGGSENNLQLETKINHKEFISNNYYENTSEKDNSLLNKKFGIFKELTKNKLKFETSQKLIYSLSIFGIVLILGFMLLFISNSKKNKSNLTNQLLIPEKKF